MDTAASITKNRHRDVYRSFYTTDDQLVSYMVRLLAPEDGHSCLEPSAGSGCFIDGLLATGKRLKVQAIDFSDDAVAKLRAKYAALSNVEIIRQDFLLSLGSLFDDTSVFDRIIANPPYGGWQDYEKRSSLKAQFPDLYVRETYGLFVARSLSKLRLNGRAVFILPETFLYLHLQKALRQKILARYSLASVDIFPSAVFPGVNFGYAKLCIVSLDNREPAPNQVVSVRQCRSLEELVSGNGERYEINQLSVLQRQEFTFPLTGQTPETELIDEAELRLGDVAACVTGIYTGDDTRFLRRSASNPRGARKYHVVHSNQLIQRGDFQPTLDGFDSTACFLSLLKGGGIPYLKPEMWFIDWSTAAVQHYKSDKKARFQNSSFYFRRGIGFPMVSSGRATASVIQESRLFDQSVVGVFPKEREVFGFLLAFLNSTICWKLLRQINPSANNSAKYLRRLPIVLPSPERLSWFSRVVSEYLTDLENGTGQNIELERSLDEEVCSLYAYVLQRV